MPILSLKLFGQPEVKIDGEKVTGFHSNKARALLFYLAVTGQAQARTVLASMFWGDYPEDRAMSNLRKTLSNLNKLVGDYLHIERDRVSFDRASDYRLDVDVFQTGLEKLDSDQAPEAAERAVGSYEGEFLEGFTLNDAPEWENWIRLERQSFQEDYQRALLVLARTNADQGDYAQAIQFTQTLVYQEPWREDAQHLLMTLYAKNGQRGQALRQYEAYCQILADDLDIPTSPETEALAAAIRSGEIGPPETTWTKPGVHSAFASITQQPPFLNPAGIPARKERHAFVGRERELAQLDEYLQAAIEGDGKIAFVTGEAGTGKSTLLAEFSRQAQELHPDLIVASGTCDAFSGSGDPYLPFREILGLLCGDVEGRLRAGTITREQAERLWKLTPTTAQALVQEGAGLLDFFVSGRDLLQRLGVFAAKETVWFTRLRELVEEKGGRRAGRREFLSQFGGVFGTLAGAYPLILILDDLQWADNSSLDLLFHLTRRLPGRSMLILGAYRPSDVVVAGQWQQESGSSPSLPALIRELKRRSGQIEIDLGRISEAREREFVDALIDSEPNRLGEAFRTAFYQHTKGHALFSVEMLREMQDRGDLSRSEDGAWMAAQTLDWDHLPARVEAVISQRVIRLDEDLRQLLAAASVEGERFTAQVLARALDRDEQIVIHQLSLLAEEHRLVHELGDVDLTGRRIDRYRFNHVLFQEYLYQNLGQAERRLLHQEIAAALETFYADQLAAVTVPLAQHFMESGQKDKAIPYLLAAGDRARNQNAFQEAVEHYQRGLTLLKERGSLEEAARTLMKIGLTYHNASNFEQARLANREAFRLWQQVAHRRSGISLPPAAHALRIAGENFSGNLDPGMVKETPRAVLLQQLFSGLMRLGPDLELVPEIARGWDVLDHGRVYLFHLRDEYLWSDGVPVTAGDFEFAWKRVLDPATGSPNATDLFDVRGARSFHLGHTGAEEVGITALDDSTLQIELDQVSPYFPNKLFFESTKPVPRHAVERYGPDWVEPDQLVTNGPFRLVSYSPGEKMILARNPDYHGSFTGNLERVEIRLGLGEDRLRHLEMYLADELDVLYTFPHLPPELQSRLREERLGEYRSGPSLATWLVGFVLDQPPFNDRRVRRAFAMAVDRHMLANVVHSGLVSPATGGFLTPIHAAYSEGIALPYDPEQARLLLATAGYPDGDGLPTIEMVNGHASLSVEADLQYLQAQWRDNLGVNLVWETIWEMGAFLRRMREKPPHLFFIRWAGKYTDPDDFLLVESSMIWELARWHDQDYFALVHDARQLSDWRQRTSLYQQADRKLVEEAVLLPLVYDQTHFLVKPWVRGFVPSAIQRWPLSEVLLEPHE